MYADTDLTDIETLGATIEGLTIIQIKKLAAYYKHMTHDFDLEQLDMRTKNL